MSLAAINSTLDNIRKYVPINNYRLKVAQIEEVIRMLASSEPTS